MKKWHEEKILLGIVIMLCFAFLLGCNNRIKMENGMQNAEQRDYATVLLVTLSGAGKDYSFSLGIAEEKKVGEKSQTEKIVTLSANNFEELARNYASVKGKTLSLVHLKAIILVRDEDTVMESLWDILTQIDDTEEISKTCPVLQLKDRDEFLKYVENAAEPVGSYLEALIKINEGQGKSIPQVKEYLQAFREGEGLQLYFLEKAEDDWIIKCRDKLK